MRVAGIAPSPLRFNRHTECSPLARGGLGPIRRGRDVCLSAGGGGRCKNPRSLTRPRRGKAFGKVCFLRVFAPTSVRLSVVRRSRPGSVCLCSAPAPPRSVAYGTFGTQRAAAPSHTKAVHTASQGGHTAPATRERLARKPTCARASGGRGSSLCRGAGRCPFLCAQLVCTSKGNVFSPPS
jgi:hypothetical protein